MRLFRILGPAVAAAALLAIVAAGSASAVTLCEENANPCPAGKEYKVGTTIEGELNPLFEAEIVIFDKAKEEKGELEKPFATIKCTKGTFKGASTKNEGPEAALIGEITPGAFTGCSTCTNGGKPLKAPYKTELLWDPAVQGDGLLNMTTGTGGGIPAWEFTGCPLGVGCTWGENNISKIRVMGGNPAQVRMTNAPLTFQAGNPWCQKKGKITAWYNVTMPAKAVFVEAKP
ncbi:MAG TPA: hypothetical protein VHQ43_11895 [Solirubrobacterales bacterium]|jgi:hypothetical protein|nr:hypothetical protein [Solirubrobacterales bacterium]